MTVFARAREAFHKEWTHLDFDVVCADHALGERAYIIKGPTLFVLAREVHPGWTNERIVDETETSVRSDHLHVTLVAGDLAELLAMIPDHIRSISFQKRGYELRWATVRRLKERLKVP